MSKHIYSVGDRRGRLGHGARQRDRDSRSAGHPLRARSGCGRAHCGATRINPKLPGIRVDDNVVLTSSSRAPRRRPSILIAVPTQELRAAATALAPHLAERTPVIACAKGIERGTQKFVTEIIAETAAARDAGDPVGTGLCAGHRPRPADGGDDRSA